jgi:exoribonuclease R
MSLQGSLYTKDYVSFHIYNDIDECIGSFKGAKQANQCLQGDEVAYNPTTQSCTLISRAPHPPIVGTLELASKTTYGMTGKGYPIYLFIPYDMAYPPMIVGCSEHDRSHNRIALVRFDHWDKSQAFPRGNLQQILGISGDLEAEQIAILRQYCPHKALPRMTPVDKPLESAKRERTRLHGFTFNIDPPGCKDIDDILTISRLPATTTDDNTSRWNIWITISDVAHIVHEMMPVDIMAATIGQTFYKEGEAVYPMLPASHSEDACSLVPNQERYGISLGFIWNDSQNKIEGGVLWAETAFENQRSYTYDEFQTSPLPERHILARVSSYLEGTDTLLEDSHKWIEACMKFYNIEAAKLLLRVKTGILRRHNAPDMDRLNKYESFDTSLRTLAFESAEYCLADADTSDFTHHGIGCVAYCHATSPIRRYADLMNQRILKCIICGDDPDNMMITVSVRSLNLRAKASKQYERDLRFIKAIASGEIFSAIILDINSVEEDANCKIRFWVPEWGRTISNTYKKVRDGIILSRDEKEEMSVCEGQNVRIECAVNTTTRRWKDRIIMKLHI